MPGQSFEVSHAALDIGEGKPTRVHLLQKGLHGSDGLFVAGRRSSLAETNGSISAGELDDNNLEGMCASSAGNFPFMRQLQVNMREVQFHPNTKAEIGVGSNKVVLPKQSIEGLTNDATKALPNLRQRTPRGAEGHKGIEG